MTEDDVFCPEGGFMSRTLSIALLATAPLITAGCSPDGHDAMGPMGPSDFMGAPGNSFLSTSPRGGEVGVAPSSNITIGFGAEMGVGMEQYVDLHRGDLGGPRIPMTCDWSGDRTTLTCTPREPLESGTTYWLHLGGGMMTTAGTPVDFDTHGPAFGGQWIQGGMMGGSHAGQPWGAMGAGWQHGNGTYGMAFAFTTA